MLQVSQLKWDCVLLPITRISKQSIGVWRNSLKAWHHHSLWLVLWKTCLKCLSANDIMKPLCLAVLAFRTLRVEFPDLDFRKHTFQFHEDGPRDGDNAKTEVSVDRINLTVQTKQYTDNVVMLSMLSPRVADLSTKAGLNRIIARPIWTKLEHMGKVKSMPRLTSFTVSCNIHWLSSWWIWALFHLSPMNLIYCLMMIHFKALGQVACFKSIVTRALPRTCLHVAELLVRCRLAVHTYSRLLFPVGWEPTSQ